MKNRTWGVRAATLTAITGLLFAACSPSDGDDDDDDTSDAAESKEMGGSLTIGRTGDIDGLDPHLGTAFQTIQTLELVYDSLFELNEHLEAVPALAEDYEFNASGTRMTIFLREGVTFHDDSALDSGDVKATLERLLDEDVGAVTAANLASIKEIAAPDETTVVLELSQPDSTLPYALAEVNAAIVPSEAIENETVAQEPVGTGAFAWDVWEQGESVKLTGYEDYWGDEGPFVDDVTFRVIPDEPTLQAGMQSGEFDIGVFTDPAVVNEVDDNELTVERTPALSYHVLMLNNSGKGPGKVEALKDEKVRQAISCAIDRDKLIDDAAFGEGNVTGPFTTPEFFGEPYAGLPCDGPDVEMAKQLMADAGYEDGFELETIVITGEYETAVAEATSVQAQLKEINVDLELVEEETNTYVDRWLATEFDAAMALNGGRPDAHHMYARYFSSEGNLNSVATHSSDELDSLFARGLAETNQDARTGIYSEISENLLEASPWAWLFTGFEYRVLQKNVEGFVPMPTGSLESLRSVSLS